MADGLLCTGHVSHQRVRPLRHRLRYRVYSLLLDLDALPALHRRLRLFSLGRFNLFGFDPRDHGDGSGTPLRAQIERQLAAAGLPTGGAIRLLCMPRLLGHGFNPLTVWFCHAPDGALAAMLYEVHNTFGERHAYLVPLSTAQAARARDTGVLRQHCAKGFHVSPFLGMDLRYDFHVEAGAGAHAPHAPHARPGAPMRIGVTVRDAQGPVLAALLDTRQQPLNDRALLRVFFSHPLLTLKVVGAIHWEALRLWLKGAPFHSHRAAPAQPVTLVRSEEP